MSTLLWIFKNLWQGKQLCYTCFWTILLATVMPKTTHSQKAASLLIKLFRGSCRDEKPGSRYRYYTCLLAADGKNHKVVRNLRFRLVFWGCLEKTNGTWVQKQHIAHFMEEKQFWFIVCSLQQKSFFYRFSSHGPGCRVFVVFLTTWRKCYL